MTRRLRYKPDIRYNAYHLNMSCLFPIMNEFVTLDKHENSIHSQSNSKSYDSSRVYKLFIYL